MGIFPMKMFDGQQTHEMMLNIIIREMKMNDTIRYHLTPIRTSIINKTINYTKILLYTLSMFEFEFNLRCHKFQD